MYEGGSRRAYRFAFAVEQNLGHRTHFRNLQRYVPEDPEVRAEWLPIEYDDPPLWQRCLGPLGTNMTVRTSLKAWRAVRRAARAERPDAVFYHTQTAGLVGSFDRSIPSVVSLDATPINFDSLGAHYGHAVGGPLEGMKTRVYAAVFRAAAALVTWSRWAADSLVDDYGVPADKITVVAPGVDLADWPRPDPRGPKDLGHRPKILFVGGDLARKGGDTLLRAFRERLDGRCELHVVTQSPLEPGPNLYVYQGVKPNSPTLRRLYAEADVFAFPTLADCLPQVVPEAMAAGLPVVTTRVGAIGEVVEHGRTGLLVEVGDPSGLAHAIEELLDHPDARRAMGEAARQRVEAICDARKNAARIVQVLKDVSAGHPARRGAAQAAI